MQRGTKRAGVTILLSDKIDLKSRLQRQDGYIIH